MSFRGRGKAYDNTGNRTGNGAQAEVEILGWNGATPAECVAFIARKCKVTVSNYLINNVTGGLKGYVASDKLASDLVLWSGVQFAGQPLRITKLQLAPVGGAFSGGLAGSKSDALKTLSDFLQARYDPASKFLNLSSVQQDPALAAKGFFSSATTVLKFFPALMGTALNLKLDVTSVDLSNNNLTDLSQFSTLSHTFPALQNLLLQNNRIARVKSFEVWKRKFFHVRELIVGGNPFVANASANDATFIKTELMKIFPRLAVLNGEMVRNEQLLMQNFSIPFATPQPMFFLDSEVQGISTNFISNYMNLWDTDRPALMVLYQNESQFSLQVDLALPHNLEKPMPDFGFYMPNSRNLTRLSSAKARAGKLAVGQEQIFKLFSQLPQTRHELMTKPEHFSMESYKIAQLGAISITLHGTLYETAQPQDMDHVNGASGAGRNKFSHNKKLRIPLSRKSFDRTFIVIPGPNNSMVVASDLLCVRPEAEADAFKPSAVAKPAAPASQTPTPHASTPTPAAPGAPGAAVPPSVASLPAELKTTLNAAQQELLVKVILETRLNIEYGFMLCQQSSWDYQQCIVNYKNSAASLPPNAYTQ